MTIDPKVAIKMYDALSKIDGFAKDFPHLMEQLKKCNVWTWDNRAITGEPSPVDVRRILDMELKGMHAYAVLDNAMLLGGRDAVHMTSYLFLTDDEDTDVNSYGNNTYYAIADVYNDTWDLHELGDVFIKSCPAGGPRRVG